MSNQFKPVDKKLMEWAQNLATDPHEFTHVLYNQARTIQELKTKLDIAHNWVLDNQIHSESYNQFVKALQEQQDDLP